MKILVSKNTEVVQFIGHTAEVVENGVDVGGLIFPNSALYDIVTLTTVPSGTKAFSTCYNSTDGFYANPDYNRPENGVVDELKVESADLKARLADMELAMADIFAGTV